MPTIPVRKASDDPDLLAEDLDRFLHGAAPSARGFREASGRGEASFWVGVAALAGALLALLALLVAVT